jgi:hypothetical protein
MFNFPQKTPADAKIGIGFPYPLLNHASHTSQSLKGIKITDIPDIPFSADFHIEQVEEKIWNYYVLLMMDFKGRLRLETFNGFVIRDGYEDILYTPGIINTVMQSSMNEFWKKLEDYAKQNSITDVPEKGYYNEKISEAVMNKVMDKLMKYGLLSDKKDSWELKPCLVISEGYLSGFIFSNTYHIIDLLLNHPDFARENNRTHIANADYMTHTAHLLTIKHKCLFNLGKSPVTLTMQDTIWLTMHVELAMQCMAGQIWNKLQPLMRERGFGGKDDETEFMIQGRNFFLSTKKIFEPANIGNYNDIPLWDEVLS